MTSYFTGISKQDITWLHVHTQRLFGLILHTTKTNKQTNKQQLTTCQCSVLHWPSPRAQTPPPEREETRGGCTECPPRAQWPHHAAGCAPPEILVRDAPGSRSQTHARPLMINLSKGKTKNEQQHCLLVQNCSTAICNFMWEMFI